MEKCITMELRLGENIVRLRKERGLTQEQLAKLLNVTVGAVSKWENGNNRPDIELLPILADVLQVSIDTLLGYEKAYKNLEENVTRMKELLLEEKYDEVIELGMNCLRRYPNDFQLNKLLADSYYSQYFSAGIKQADDKKENALYFYERCIELYDSKKNTDITEEALYIQIATLCMWDKEGVGRALQIVDTYNDAGKYDNLRAGCLLQMGQTEEARKIVVHHAVANQIFCFNDFTTLADMCEKKQDYESAIRFLEAQVRTFEVFMKEEASYADRAFAGQGYIIADLYGKMKQEEKQKEWLKKAKKHALKYNNNPSMEIASMRFCEGVEGRMIDNFGQTLKLLAEMEL